MRRVLVTFLFSFLLVPHARAAGRELAPRTPIPVADSRNIDVATAGDRFLTAWTATSGAIYGAIADAHGVRTSPYAFLVAEPNNATDIEIAVVGTGDSFAVFWTDTPSPLIPRTVHMTDVSLDGQILVTRTLALPSAEKVRATWDGERFLVALYRENRFANRSVAAIVARDGAVLRGDILLDPAAQPAHVAVMDDGFLVFSRGRDFLAHAIRDDGSVTQSIAGDPGVNVVSAAIGDGRLLVAYLLDDGQLRTMVWKNGVKLGEHTLLVDRDAVPAGIDPGNGAHLLAYGREKLYTIPVDDAGAPLAEPVFINVDFRDARAVANSEVLFVAHRREGVVLALPLPAEPGTMSQMLSLRPAPQSHVVVGTGGGSMIALWNEARGDGASRIRAAKIGRDFDVEEVHELVAEGSLAIRKLAWNGTEYLVVYQNYSAQLFALRVAYDGTAIGEPRLLAEPGDPVHAAVAWAGDRWAVAWVPAYGSWVVYYQTVSHGGVPTPYQELDLTKTLAFDVALAFDGNRLHLAWIETAYPYYPEPPPQGYAVRVARLRRTGRVVDPDSLVIPATHPRDLAIAASNERVVLMVDDEEHTTGRVIDARSLQIRATRTFYDGFASVSDVTWTGYTFVAAIHHRDNDRTLLEIHDLGSDGTATNAPRVTETLAKPDLHVSVASTPAYDAVAGLQESDAVSGERAVIYAEREMFRVP